MHDQTLVVLANLASPFLAGVVSVVISGWLYTRHERRSVKLETLRRLIATRSALVPQAGRNEELLGEFFRALNEVFVLYESRRVRDALDRLHAAIASNAKKDEELRGLFAELCREVGITPGEFATRVFMKPFHW